MQDFAYYVGITAAAQVSRACQLKLLPMASLQHNVILSFELSLYSRLQNSCHINLTHLFLPSVNAQKYELQLSLNSDTNYKGTSQVTAATNAYLKNSN